MTEMLVMKAEQLSERQRRHRSAFSGDGFSDLLCVERRDTLPRAGEMLRDPIREEVHAATRRRRRLRPAEQPVLRRSRSPGRRGEPLASRPASLPDRRTGRSLRINRDTLYSSAILDVSKAPRSGCRKRPAAIRPRWSSTRTTTSTTSSSAPGEYRLEASMFPTAHVAVAIRTLVDPADPEEPRGGSRRQDRLANRCGKR